MVIMCVNAFLTTASLCSLLFITLHIKYTKFELVLAHKPAFSHNLSPGISVSIFLHKR